MLHRSSGKSRSHFPCHFTAAAPVIAEPEMLLQGVKIVLNNPGLVGIALVIAVKAIFVFDDASCCDFWKSKCLAPDAEALAFDDRPFIRALGERNNRAVRMNRPCFQFVD